LNHLPPVSTHLGQHLLAEFFDCNANILNNPSLIETLMKEAALACGATIVQSCFHRFDPIGVSGVVVIAESHLTIHTWPELGYASIDLYTCGDQCDPALAFDYLHEHLMCANANYSRFNRGLLNPATGELTQQAATLVAERYLEASPHAMAEVDAEVAVAMG